MRLVRLVLLAGVFFAGCEEDAPRFVLEARIDFTQVPELYSLEVEWDRLALQRDDEELGPNPPKGHGVLLDPSWVELPTRTSYQRFVRSSSAYQVLYSDAVETGAMGRVWPMATGLKTATASGREYPVHSILEPVSVKFPLLAGMTTTLRVDLMVLRNLGARAGTYALYTRGAYWAEGTSRGASVREAW